MFNKQKGFTLIELLVVIAIIGLLAGIVLVSLGGARDSAKDARVIAAVSQTRSLAELVSNSNNGNYQPGAVGTNLCDAANSLNDGNTIYGGDLAAVENEVIAQVGSGIVTSCQANPTNFCVYAPLNATGQFYCIDSTATAIQTGTPPGGVGFCTATTFVCP